MIFCLKNTVNILPQGLTKTAPCGILTQINLAGGNYYVERDS